MSSEKLTLAHEIVDNYTPTDPYPKFLPASHRGKNHNRSL